MSEPFVGEIRIVGFNFAPVGWALCNGQTLAIAQNEALFALIGTIYGGDGQTTFKLPDLQGRFPFHQGTNSAGDTLTIGSFSGAETVALTVTEIPKHTHVLRASSAAGTQPNPSAGLWATSSLEQLSTEAPTGLMDPRAISTIGGGLPHDNMPPFQVVNFIISLFGIFPSQN